MNELKNKLKGIHRENSNTIQKFISSKTNVIASVLVALQFNNSTKSWNVLLTQRSTTLNSFPGQVAFPGGNIETDDVDEEATALRETREEIGMPDFCVDIVARLPPQIVGAKLVHSCIGIINDNIDILASVRLVNNIEVDAVFFAPISLFLSQDCFSALPYNVNKNGKQFKTYFPQFSLSCPGLRKENNQEIYDSTISTNVFGFTAIMCVYTAILVCDRGPEFDGPSVNIFAHTATEVYQDLVDMQTFVRQHFHLDHLTVVPEAKL